MTGPISGPEVSSQIHHFTFCGASPQNTYMTQATSKRKSIRFHSTPMSTAAVDLNLKNKFQPTIMALVANESFTGCALVLVTDSTLVLDQVVRIKIGDLDPLNARVVWCKTLEENIKKVGLEFKT